jgi:hypothetical protein
MMRFYDQSPARERTREAMMTYGAIHEGFIYYHTSADDLARCKEGELATYRRFSRWKPTFEADDAVRDYLSLVWRHRHIEVSSELCCSKPGCARRGYAVYHTLDPQWCHAPGADKPPLTLDDQVFSA